MKYLCDNCENYPCDDSEVKLMYRCPGFNPIPKPMTNAAKIRAMTDEELAELIGDNIDCSICAKKFESEGCPNLGSCYNVWLDWLKGGI